MIYRLYPDVRVIDDDRHDLYGEQFFKNYLTITRVEPGWEQLLSQLKANWVLMPKNSPLICSLERKDRVVRSNIRTQLPSFFISSRQVPQPLSYQ